MAGINMGNATPGLTRLAAAIGGGPGSAYQNAYDHELKLESSIAQALAAQEASRAQARLHNLQSDELQQQSAARSPDAILGSALTTYGIPQQDAPAVSEYLKTGQLGGKYRMPEDGMGPVAPAPDYAPQLGSVARTIGTMNQALTLGDKNIHNVSQAEEQRRVSGNAQGVLNGTVDPTTFAQSQYAARGNAPYAFHEFGVGNNLTGAVDATGAPAQNFAQYRQAETQHQQAGAKAQVASAANSYASADAHRASAAKTRQEMEQGIKTGALQVVTGDDGTVSVINKATREVMPGIGPDGKPFQGKGKDLNGEQANALTFATRMQAADAILNDLAKQGVTRGGNIKGIAEGAGRIVGLGTSAGDALGDALGAATNFTQSPAQQRVEQAKRDFINAILRRESGAAISMGEFANGDKQYFPQPGDTPQVIAQKAASRQRVIEGMLQAVPASRRPTFGAPPAVTPPAPFTGGATGSFAAPAAQRNVRVNY